MESFFKLPAAGALFFVSAWLRVLRGMVGVSGVAGWDGRALALTVDEAPVGPGFEVVVVGAEPVEQVDQGDLGSGPGEAVVGFEPGGLGAAVDGAGRVEPF